MTGVDRYGPMPQTGATEHTKRNRAVSTVLDVALCLLLISAAVGVIGGYLATAAADDSHDSETATQAAELTGSTTITAEYTLDPALENAGDDSFDPLSSYTEDERTRLTHGPAAGLLADAALANLTIDEKPLTHEGALFEDALEGPLANVFFVVDGDVSVTARWTPYEGASLEGLAESGPTPPPTGDVSSVTMTVPSGFESATGNGVQGGEHGMDRYEDVAAAVAITTVEGYFPPEETTLALQRGGLDRDRTIHRYIRFATAVDGLDSDELEEPLAQSVADTERANAKLIEGLTDELAADMEERFETPEDAAAATATDEVTIVVRVWDT